MDIDRSVCKFILNQIYPKEKYDLIEWKLEGFNQVVGFHGHHNILKITINVKGKEKTESFFVKSATTHQHIFENYFSKIRCFEKEHIMLTKVIGTLQEQVKERLTAQCYLSKLNKFSVLEDLSVRGYRASGENSTRWDHVTKAAEKLAALHAASFILEERSGKGIQDKYPEFIFETFFNDIKSEEGLTFRSPYNVFCHFVDHRMEDIPPEMKMPFKEWLIETVYLRSRPSLKYRSVVCHGDPWCMNFMYKYNSKDEVEDVLMVDFQVSRIAPPASDLQEFLALTYKNEERPAYDTAVANVYYDRLSIILQEAGLKVADILPKETFQESFDLFSDFGHCCQVLYTMTVRLPQSTLSTIKTPEAFVKLMTKGDTDLCTAAFDGDQQYRESCSDTIQQVYLRFLNSLKK